MRRCNADTHNPDCVGLHSFAFICKECKSLLIVQPKDMEKYKIAMLLLMQTMSEDDNMTIVEMEEAIKSLDPSTETVQ